MEMAIEETALTNLVASLEQATLMAKQLPITTDPSQILQIYSTLHASHHHLSSFLAQSNPHPHPPPQPSLPPPPKNSFSSAVGNDIDEPMQVVDGDDEVDTEQNYSKSAAIERVEERMRDFFIQNKRSKRPLSPSAAAAEEQRRSYEREIDLVRSAEEFDPHRSRLRSFNLIYQFHS